MKSYQLLRPVSAFGEILSTLLHLYSTYLLLSIENKDDTEPSDEIHLLALLSPKGENAKRVIMNPSNYVPQPHDIVAESWVPTDTMR